MKRIKIGGVAAAIFLAASSWASSLEVTDVKIAQRYPWNGLVDITYTVKSDNAEKDVWVYPVGYDADTATSVALMPQYLSGEGVSNAVHQGTHRMTWNMAEQMGKGYNRAAFSVKLHAFCDAAPYMVIDLSAGSEATKYDVSYLLEIPEGGWTAEPYKTTKMVFRLILPGKGNQGVITKPYYIAVFPMTERQYCLINGGTATTPTAWMSGVSYDMLRGSVLGSQWPQYQQVDADSVMGKLRLRTGITLDIPTSEQWYRAACADVHTELVSPNVWGLYAFGEIGEWNLNWYGDMSGNDPVGPYSNINKARAISGRYFPASYGSWTSAVAYLGAKEYSSTGSRSGYNYYESKNYYNSKVKVAQYGFQSNPSEGAIGARLVALPLCK